MRQCIRARHQEKNDKGTHMVTKDEIFRRIQTVLIDTFEMEEQLITPESRVFDDLDLDSFDAVDLAVVLEVKTGIKLKEGDLRSIKTISDIIDIVHEKMNKVKELEK
jgi:acyl carrier protein